MEGEQFCFPPRGEKAVNRVKFVLTTQTAQLLRLFARRLACLPSAGGIWAKRSRKHAVV